MMRLVFSVIYLLLKLQYTAASHERTNIELSQYQKIIVIGDIESNILQFFKILQQLQICDQNMNWIANDTILVQTGNLISKQWNPLSIPTIELFIKLHRQAPAFNSLCIGILGEFELYHLHRHITGKHRMQKSDTIAAIIRRLNGNKHRIQTSVLDSILSPQHSIGQYLRSLSLAVMLGKSIFINNANTLFINDKHNIYSVDYINSKIDLYFRHEFGDNQLFSKVFYPSSEFQSKPICTSVDSILHLHNANRIVHGGEINLEIEKAYKCNGKLVSVNCGIAMGGFGALEIEIVSENMYVHSVINQTYVRMPLASPESDNTSSSPKRFSLFSYVSLGLESHDYLDNDEASFSFSLNSPLRVYAVPK